ncbi:phage tail sheath subtilisin-like domain-containing protein [Chromobacterium piscinae]|uniref:phage tail sheath subtilisin-like domain-containing protein n=1 Tax=Chromobacterium piscinae TaxID=686831 RepID=UPI0031FBCF13
MASANISFDQIPASIRKPGKYFEFNTKLAVRTLPGNPQRVLVIGQRLADTAAQPALAALDVFSDEQAAQAFGRGSNAHLMARAAINANPYLQLTVIGVDDAAAGTAASGSFTFSGPAAAAGVLSLFIGAARVDVAVSAGAAKEVLTLAARHKGSIGNGITVKAQEQIAGLGVTPAQAFQLKGGAGEPDLVPVLGAVVSGGHQIIASPFTGDAALTALRNHLDFVSGPLEQRGAIGVIATTGALADASALSAKLDSGRITAAWYRGSAKLSADIAAAYAAVIASEEDPARPLNTLELKGLDVVDLASRTSRTEQENALYNGVTPLEVAAGDRVQIVRAISTYTKDAQGVDDVSLLDITTIRTLDYVRKACRERIALRFPREKLSDRTPSKVRSELLDVLYKLEELEIIEQVEANKAGLIVERDLQDVNRLDAKIPVDVVNGLHVFAGRIDLLL